MAVFIIGIVCSSYAMGQGYEFGTGETPHEYPCLAGSHYENGFCVKDNYTSVAPILLASTWIVAEHSPTSRFVGTWIRRPGTNTFDASWNGIIKDVIDIISIQGNNIVLHRQQQNGDYTGTISADGNSISGTASWYEPGSGWSASIRSSKINYQSGKINYDQLKSFIRPGDIIYGSENIKGTKIRMFPSHIAIIIRGKNDKGEDDLLVREAYLSSGVSNISLKDFCECGGYHKEPKTISNIFDKYDDIKILRAKCSNEQAEKAAEEAIKIKGKYDLSYFTEVIDLMASISHGMALPQAIKSATNLKKNWDDSNKWYCSEFVYKAYRRAGFDIFPKKGTCPSPLALLFSKKGEYPYLDVGIPLLEDGKCPWCLITPEHVLKSKYVHEIWSWKKPPAGN